MLVTYCRKCSVRIPDGAYFCSSCGDSNFLEVDQSDGLTLPSGKKESLGNEYATVSMGSLEYPELALPRTDTEVPEDKYTTISTPARTDIEVPEDKYATVSTSEDKYATLSTPEYSDAIELGEGRSGEDATLPLQSMALKTYIYEISDDTPAGSTPVPLSPQEMTQILEGGEHYYPNEERDAIAAHPTVPLNKPRDDTHDDEIVLLPGQFTDAPTLRAEHKQPMMQRGEHQQPTSIRGDHKQPMMQRGTHQQPVSMRGTHQQPAYANAPHFQLAAPVQRRPRQQAVSLQNVLIGVGTLVITGVMVFLLLPIFRPNTSSGPGLALVNASSAFPGGSVKLHGTNFTPGASVSFMVDGTILVNIDRRMAHNVVPRPNVSMSVALFSSQLYDKAVDAETIVQSNGSFDATITIPQSWQVNTTHDIQAIESGSGQKALTKVTVVDNTLPTSTPTPIPTSMPTPNLTPVPTVVAATPTPVQVAVVPTATPIPPVPTAIPTATPPCVRVNNAALTFSATVGGGAPNTQSLTISNGTGCGAGNWSLKTDTAWLTVNHANGTIAVNGTASVSVAVSIANLNAGIHTGHINLSPGTGVVTVTLTVQQLPPCITATTNTLSFTAMVGGTAPSQTATIANGSNCSAGTWSVASDAGWLLVSGGGTIASGGSANATVNISTARLVVGSRTGHLTFSAPGSNPATVTVTLTVQQLPTCITATTGTLNFSITVGGTATGQTATIANGSNCSAGTWSVASDAGWLLVSGGGTIASGGSASVTVNVAATNLAVGTYTGHLTFSAPGSNPATVTVTLVVQQVIIQ